MERAVRHLVKRHREADAAGECTPIQAAREKQIDTLKRATKKIKAWLSKNEDKLGATGRTRKSNLTDNESAKMKTSKGVIQGYDGVAMVDAKHQVVVHAEAFGEVPVRDRHRRVCRRSPVPKARSAFRDGCAAPAGARADEDEALPAARLHL
jgi:hypothetical protein